MKKEYKVPISTKGMSKEEILKLDKFLGGVIAGKNKYYYFIEKELLDGELCQTEI